MTRPLKVFLSHAHADADAVRTLYDRLVADGVDAWLDKEKLVGGQNWQNEIRKAVREADVVIIFLSKESVNKAGFVQKEIAFALDRALEMPEGRIYLIPARLENCEVPHRLSSYHWVDLFEEGGYEKILLSLELRSQGIINELKETKNNKIFSRKQKPSPFFLWDKSKKIIATFLFMLLATVLFRAFYTFNGLGIIKALAPDPPTFPPTYTLAPAILTGTPTKTLTSTPTPHTEQIADLDPVGNIVLMNFIISQEFIMGSDNGEDDEKPAHPVYLDSFYIDQYEISNALYKACVEFGRCTKPHNTKYYDSSNYANYPVIYVSWYQAKNYCEWRESYLPSEAQWEKAARGTEGRIYPWGDQIDCGKANYAPSCLGGIEEIGRYEDGRSPYGLYDMAGNVWEWVDDWYIAYPDNNTLDTDYGTTYKVLRGGSWYYENEELSRTTYRDRLSPDSYYLNLGFRCAKDAP